MDPTSHHPAVACSTAGSCSRSRSPGRGEMGRPWLYATEDAWRIRTHVSSASWPALRPIRVPWTSAPGLIARRVRGRAAMGSGQPGGLPPRPAFAGSGAGCRSCALTHPRPGRCAADLDGCEDGATRGRPRGLAYMKFHPPYENLGRRVRRSIFALTSLGGGGGTTAGAVPHLLSGRRDLRAVASVFAVSFPARPKLEPGRGAQSGTTRG